MKNFFIEIDKEEVDDSGHKLYDNYRISIDAINANTGEPISLSNMLDIASYLASKKSTIFDPDKYKDSNTIGFRFLKHKIFEVAEDSTLNLLFSYKGDDKDDGYTGYYKKFYKNN
jgi:hypothetical protein